MLTDRSPFQDFEGAQVQQGTGLQGNAELECVIRRIAPAETIVQFAYGG